MAGRLTPPPFPLRQADEYSSFLSKGLLLSYLMLEAEGSTLKNYGSWGSAADLQLNNVKWVRRDSGLYGLEFPNSTSIAGNSTIRKDIPTEWSYAVWVKADVTPTAGSEIFVLRGPSQNNLRLWADSTGIWSWQRRANADAYTVMPPSEYPTDGARLLIGTFSGADYPPVQLTTNSHMRSHPEQPFSYQAVNEGAGAQIRDTHGIFLGNNNGSTAPWRGTIGPFYFWDRPLTEAEIWQLWQDPYAPFRRSTSQVIVPSTFTAQADGGMQSLGKDGSGVVLRNNNAIYIFVNDQYSYREVPDEEVIVETIEPIVIEVNDQHNYSNIPLATDQVIIGDTWSQDSLVITIGDNHSYEAIPLANEEVNILITDTIAPVIVTVTDQHNYADVQILHEELGSDTGAQDTIMINTLEDHNYVPVAEEEVITGA